jgi:AcrR family transcriptional regulator
MGRHNKSIDYNRIERLYRAGLLSVNQIAKECSVAEANIRYHAKKKGWKRDLSAAVRQATRTKMVENLAKISHKDMSKAGILAADGMTLNDRLELVADEQIIEQAAKTQIEVVRTHQATLGQGHSLTIRMLSELDATTAFKEELQQLISSTVAPSRQEALRRAISLGTRATIMRDLATAARLWVTLERQAFNIVDDTKDNNEQRRIDESKTAEDLRREILDDAKKLGLQLSADDLGISKANGKVTH